ncbi:hypothetical protein KC19_1G273000 [Ceratodon purpureus]|uniref:Uncharacterized protein n=1 Tax=Ceratodon purpureus TaxID=3225 RepID=A0A8T0JCY3_CERPU|nr:hypothetical protein KC19_1G273000 [Ceratodon purpureus]
MHKGEAPETDTDHLVRKQSRIHRIHLITSPSSFHLPRASGKKVVMVGLLLALLVVSSQASVTVVNLAGLVKVLVNGANVDVSTGSVKVDVKGGKSQDILVRGPNGKDIKVNVKDGDVVVLVPDVFGNGGIIVNVNGEKAN